MLDQEGWRRVGVQNVGPGVNEARIQGFGGMDRATRK